MYNRAGEMSATRRVRVNFRLDPELAAWLEAQKQAGHGKTELVEKGLRLVRSGSTGASPAVPSSPRLSKDATGLARQQRLNEKRGRRS